MSELKTYECTVLFDASSNVSVQASSPEDAAAMADELCSGRQNLCHQCSDTLDTGDSVGVLVYLGDKEVADTTWHATQIAELEAARDELLTTLLHIEGAAMDIGCERSAIRDAARAARVKHGGAA